MVAPTMIEDANADCMSTAVHERLGELLTAVAAGPIRSSRYSSVVVIYLLAREILFVLCVACYVFCDVLCAHV